MAPLITFLLGIIVVGLLEVLIFRNWMKHAEEDKSKENDKSKEIHGND